MKRKYFPFCFYVLVSVLCLGKPSLAYPSGSFGGELVIPAVTATSETDSITPLKIGDKIPDELWDYAFPVVSPHADHVQYLTLGDYRDKLIILDFWATWCAPCISSLHKLDTLQQEFADDLLVFPTSYEAEDKVRPFFADNGYDLPTAFDQTHLKEYFPHRVIPHQVWINDGEVMAIGGPEYATSENIAQALSGATLKTVDRNVDLTINAGNFSDKLFEGKLAERPSYTRVIVPWIETSVGSSRSRPNQYMVFNASIPHLYHMAYITEIPFSQKKHLVKIEVSPEKERLMAPLSRTGNHEEALERLKIKRDAYFSYILEIPDSLNLEERTLMMREDLNSFFRAKFGIQGLLEKREIPSTIISLEHKGLLTSKAHLSRVPAENERLFVTMEELLRTLRFANSDGSHYFINKTGSTEEIHVVLPKDMRDIDAIKQLLSNEYSLGFKDVYEPVEVLVIKDIK